MSQPLLLDNAAYGQASGYRRGEDLIDALPYIDSITPDVKAKVDELIEEEKRRSAKTPADYLKELPQLPPIFDKHPLLQAEFERVKASMPLDPIDTTRYKLDPPPSSRSDDVNAWKEASENACSQLEHQKLRIINQELMLKHGDKALRAQIQISENCLKHCEEDLKETKAALENVNRERKLQQLATGSQLKNLEQKYYSQIHKNVELEVVCKKLEQEVEFLESRAA